MNQSSSTESAPLEGTNKEAGRLDSIPSRRFPYPTEKPTSHLVIFDGKCVFCTSQVRTLYRFDFLSNTTFISLHDPKIAEWFPELTYDQLMKQIYVIPNFSLQEKTHTNNYLEADRGIRFLALRNILFWPIGLLLSIPFTGPIWNYLYHQVAKRRYYFGKIKTENGGGMCDEDGTCHLHFGDASVNKESATPETQKQSPQA